MDSDFIPRRVVPRGGRRAVPGIDYDTYRLQAAGRVVKAFTDAARGPCDTAVVSEAEILKPQNPLIASVPSVCAQTTTARSRDRARAPDLRR